MAISDITKPMALDETLQATNGKMDSVITKLQGIIDALGLDTSVYKPKGNITCAALVPALLIDDNLGNVYNVTDNGTTTSDFVEGAGKPIHVGDNVAIVDIGTGGQSEYKFDLLAGMVDLTNYVQKSATPGLLKNDGSVDTKDYAEKVAGATSGNIAGLDGNGNLTDSGWNGAKDTTSISGNPISISGLKSNQLAKNPIITFEPIQAGSGTPSPSNIRAISGYDKIEVLSCGKNLVSGRLSGYAINTNGTFATNINYDMVYAPVVKGASYVISSDNNAVMGWFKDKPTVSSQAYDATRYSYAVGIAYTAPITGWVAFRTVAGYTTPQVEYGATQTSYVAPNKTTDLSESLGQTVYGGTLDVRTGLFTGTMAIKDMGDLTWGVSGSGTFHTGEIANSTKLVSSCYAYNDDSRITNNGNAELYLNNNEIAYRHGTNDRIYVKNTSYSDATAFKNAMVGQTVCYELATPFTIQFTPHEISLLSIYAYVSTNGTSISLDYHNGELASLSDVSQLGETVNELGDYVGIITDNNYVDCSACSTIYSIFETIMQGQSKLKSTAYGVGNIGALQNTNLKTLLGNPGLTNYVHAYIRPIVSGTNFMKLAEVYAVSTVNTQSAIKRKYIWISQSAASQSAWETINYMT